MLPFDMPYKIEDSQIKTTGIYVIAGGPCSGKTSILKALSEKAYSKLNTEKLKVEQGIKKTMKN